MAEPLDAVMAKNWPSSPPLKPWRLWWPSLTLEITGVWMLLSTP